LAVPKPENRGYARGVRLPVHEIEEELKAAVATGDRDRVLLKAPTGSGKSTAVPGMLADAGISGRILVIEPRRMAARLLAGWVAELRDASLGGEVGYAVRFDTKYGRDTRLIYLTDGVFQRWMQDDPHLKGVGAVIFDEFHERRLAVDVALGRCLTLQESVRPDLRVVVMSATLESRGLAEFLAPAKMLEAGGRAFPIEVTYRAERPKTNDRRGGPPQETPVWERITSICKEALAMPDAGDLLCFLPGMHEIRKTVEALENSSFTRNHDIFPLHGGLPPAAQEAAVSPGKRPKIIVSTNVAETSLTIEGVRTVIDAGLAREASFDPRRGIDTLLIRKISRASAEQRAGRAGRTGPGRAFRLWSESEHARREAFDAPEVRRVDLAETVLLLKAAGVGDVRSFRWLDAPLEESLGRAEALLHDLGALDVAGQLTDEGRAMAALPLEPRYSRLMLAGVEQGCVAEMAFIAAAVQGEGIFTSKRGGIGRKDFVYPGDGSDFEAEWRAFDSAAGMDFDPRRCAPLGIHGRGAREVALGFDRLHRLALQRGWPWESVDFAKRREAVGRAMLASFSDRLAVRFGEATLACRVVGKRRGKLDDESAAKQAVAFVAAEITEVEGREVIVQLRRATAIDPAWLQDLFPEDFHFTDGAGYDESRRRVVARKETRFRDLVLESKESDHGVNLDAAAEILASKVLSGELVLKNWDAAVEQWCARLDSLGKWMPDLELPGWSEEDRAAAVAQICHGAVAYKDIKERQVWPVLREWLNAPQRAALDSYAPERITLANGQNPKITYETGKDPWIALRVRDLFGVWHPPMIANGRVPLLVHILAPNMRPWQMTKDLGSFWANGYTQMKKDLAGRYPKQPWPEDPKAWLAAGGGKR
jgi:ATP-dependent helicase HrpB